MDFLYSSTNNFWIKPNALTIGLNHLGNPNLIEVTLLAGTVIMAYKEDVIPFNAAHNYRTWQLNASRTYLEQDDRCYVYARLDRDESSNYAQVVYSYQELDIWGQSSSGAEDKDHFFILLGVLSPAINEDGSKVEREWEEGFYTGSLATDQYIKEESSSDFKKMFSLNSLTGFIDVLKTISAATINTLTVAKSFILGGKTVENIDNASLSSDNKSLPTSNVVKTYVEDYTDEHFLRKDKDDTAKGKITFEVVQQFDGGLEVGEYKEGDFGSGAAMKTDENGNTYLEVDYGKFRKKATFNDLEIKSLKHVGGTVLLSPASATLSGVVKRVDGVFACYFRKTDGDGKAVKNEWRVGDQARCQSFDVDADKQRYYWRLVVGVDYIVHADYPSSDYHCILLSDADCDNLSDDPLANDEVVQFGNRSDKTRQSAILMSAYDINSDTAPCIIQYDGIDSYDLTGKEVQRWSPGNNTFSGQVKITGGEGWEKLDGLQGTLEDIEEKADSALAESALASTATSNLSVRLDGVENGVSQSIAEINNRLDGVVENYFLEGEPTLENEPAVSWTTDTEKINHVGDTYTDISEYVSDEVTPTAGKSWRWCWCDSYETENKVEVTDNQGNKKYLHWHPIADSDAVKALLQASKAQSTADGKSTTFLVKPSKYSKGDLWVLQEDTTVNGKPYKKGEILTTNTTSITFVEGHWSKQVIYTDDTKALEALESIDNLTYSASNLLRNTGFYGDDKSVRLTGESMMNVDEEMLSPSLEHWQTGGIAYSEETQLGSLSGYDLVLSIDTASQKVVTGVNANEKYVLTLRGEGTVGISIGGYETMIELTQKRIVHRFRTVSSASTITLQGLSPDTRICELMLEQGEVASNTWNRSVLDVSPEISRLQNVQYIMNALRSKAGTEILGGLVLSSMIMLSKETDSETFSNEDISCGMNGIWANNSSVAFWGGGTFQQANESVRLVYSNPTYEPTEEELDSMANYVVTHDGTVVMNRAIVRGTVFAENGQFKGKVEATSGKFGDMVLGEIDDKNYDISASEDSDGWIKYYSDASKDRWTWIAGNQQTLVQANMFLNNSVGGHCLYATCKGGVGIKVVASQAIESDGAVIFRKQHTDKDSSGETTLQMNNTIYQGRWGGMDVEENEQGMRSFTSYPTTGLETETCVRQFAGGVEMTYEDNQDKNGAVMINGNGAYLMFGKYGIKVDDEGVKKTSDGGESWKGI